MRKGFRRVVEGVVGARGRGNALPFAVFRGESLHLAIAPHPRRGQLARPTSTPCFSMIDGFRQGFFGVGDVSPWFSLAVVGTGFVVVATWALRLLVTGYKIRS